MKVSRIRGKNCRFSVNDFAVLAIIVFTLAAHDFGLLFAGVQVAGSLVIFYSYILRKAVQKRKVKYVVWQLLFAMWALFSYAWASYTIAVLVGVRSIIQVAMTGFALVLYIDSEEKVDKTLNYIAVAALVLCARMLIQVPVSAWGSERVGVYIGYGNNGAANVLTYAAVCAFYLQNRKKGSKLTLRVRFLPLVFIVFAFLCGSKKAVIIAILGIGIQVICASKRPLEIVKKIIEVVAIVCVVAYAVMNIPFFYDVLGLRIERMLLALSGETGGDSSTLDRMAFAKIAFEVFKAKPICGVGLDNFRYYNYIMPYYAHNNYLEIAADLGIVGLILYYWFPISTFIKSIKKIRFNGIAFTFTLFLIVLIMDVANVSYYLDSIQLYLAVTYAIFLQSISGGTMEERT